MFLWNLIISSHMYIHDNLGPIIMLHHRSQPQSSDGRDNITEKVGHLSKNRDNF